MTGESKVSSGINRVTKSTRNMNDAVLMAKRALRQLKESQKAAAASTKKLEVSTRGLTNQFIRVNLASRAISSAIHTMTSAFTFGISSAIEFEFTMAKISAISGIAGANLESLEHTISEIAKVSPKTGSQVAAAALEMSKMGLAGKDLENSLQGVVNLSVALDEEVSTVGRTMVAVKNTFGFAATELTDIADKMFTTLGSSALNLEKFGTAFSFSGAAAELAGVSFEELSGLMGVLADRGIKASTIGTQLRQVFLRLENGTSKASQAVGINALKIEGLEATLKALIPILEQSGKAEELFGVRAGPIIEILTQEIDKIRELTEETEKMTKSTDEASKMLQDTMQGAIDKTTSAWTHLNKEMSKFYSPVVKTGLNQIAALMNVLSGSVDDLGSTADDEFFSAMGGESPQALIKTVKTLTDKQRELAAAEVDRQALVVENAVKNKEIAKQAKIDAAIAERNAIKAVEADKIKVAETLRIAKIMQQLHVNDQKRIDDAKKKNEELSEAKTKALEKHKEALIEWRALESVLEIESSIAFQGTLLAVDALVSSVDTLGASLAHLALGGNLKEFGAMWKSFAQQMIADLIKMAVKMLLVKAISTSLGISTGGIGFAGANMFSGALLEGLGGVDTTNVKPTQKNASGFQGIISQPTTFTVGEEGAEEVMVRPRAKMSAGSSQGAGMTVIIQGDINGEEQFIDRIRSANEEIERRSM